MRKSTLVFVCITAGLSVLLGALLSYMGPAAREEHLQPLFVLGALAVMAELLGYLMSNAVVGSIAMIPYLAMVLIVPSWTAVAGIACARAIVEMRSRSVLRTVFNISQHALAAAVAVLVYRALGGVSLQGLHGLSLMKVSVAVGLPALSAILLSSAVNAALVSGVVAMNSDRPLVAAWRESFRSPLGLDLLSGPVIFVFAWVYTEFGWIAALIIWVPILGLRQVHKANLDLERVNRELLELLVKSIEARDLYTSGHSRRVQHYSTVIARLLGLSESEVEHVSRAALLHDVGKIYEKYAPILAKPDRLTPDDWATMQEHPIDGANLVATMTNLRNMVPAIRHHHENWDGSGYPDGLAGYAIPLASRIIAFADTIDAMTSERPYRMPMGEPQVRAELIRCRGSQFDPEITDRLLASPNWRLLFGSAAHVGSPSRALAIVRPDSSGKERAAQR